MVQALNGATSSTDAFALKGSLSAGAYQYYLFKGGVTAGSENNWYLRSSVVAVEPPVVAPVPPVPPVVVPIPPTPTVPPPSTPDEPVVEPPTPQPVAPVTPPAPPPTQVPAEISPETGRHHPAAANGSRRGCSDPVVSPRSTGVFGCGAGCAIADPASPGHLP